MKTYKIAYVPGDGIGPEVLAEGRKVLEQAASGCFRLEWIPFDIGAARYLKTGETLPASVLEELRRTDAIYFGAIGDPRVPPGVLERGILLRLRFELDLYVNLRPVVLYPGVPSPLRNGKPEEINFVVVRENTEGLYAGGGGVLRKGTPEEVALQVDVTTRRGVERCVRFAMEEARRRGRKKQVTLVDKANVLIHTGGLWRRVLEEVGRDYPDIRREAMYVDACAMEMVRNPARLDVVVTDNMFGDILTDLGAMIGGGIGLAASANLHPGRTSLFEPVHGSAPSLAGKAAANPIAAMLTGALLLRYIGEEKAGKRVEEAVARALASGKIRSMEAASAEEGGGMGLTTPQVGDLVARFL